MKHWLTLVITTSALSIALIVAIVHERHKGPQPSAGFVQNVYGERISWKTKKPIPLYVSDTFPVAMYPALERAIQDWEMAVGHPLFKIEKYGVSDHAQPAQDGVSMIYWLSSWEDNKNAEQARTSVYWIGDRINEADIRINAKNYRFYVDNPLAYGDVHLESLLVHELGHVLGLKHRDGDGSVMATYLPSQVVRTRISSMDTNNVSFEY